jgi:hypothetical protein
MGPILIAVPWFNDFFGRIKARRVSGIQAIGSLSSLKDELEKSLKTKLESPKVRDFVWTMAGLLCIGSSFFVGFIRGVRDLF